ncbi:MAG: glycosyltransferase [Bacteroidaceae bacterium]|nr:glycosyltransferase [Bacteroidaceae bacterium]
MAKISIIIITHNAPSYVDETLTTLHDITAKNDLEKCEIIIVDNASGSETKDLLKKAKQDGRIDKLFFSEKNTLFAGGNNIGVSLASKDSELILLLNSDVSIKDSGWLHNLVKSKQQGGYAVASYGLCETPDRADGYCFLIDRNLYDKYHLDENFEWWWSITKIQSQILQQGGNILALGNHNHLLVHYGGKSGKDFVGAKGMDISQEKVLEWFDNAPGRVFFRDAQKTEAELLQEVETSLNKCKAQLKQQTKELYQIQQEQQKNITKYKKYRRAFRIAFAVSIVSVCLLVFAVCYVFL